MDMESTQKTSPSPPTPFQGTPSRGTPARGTPPRERNILTRQKHQREVFRQITIPLLICGLVLVAFAVLVVLGETTDISQWADISLIWMIMPTMFFVFISLVFLGASVFLVVKLIIELPFLSFRIQQKLRQVQRVVSNASDRMVEPFLRYESFKAASRRAMRGPGKRKT